MPIGSFSLGGMSTAQLAVVDRLRHSIARQARRDPYWGVRDIDTPYLPPVNWQTGGAGTRANTTAYQIGQVLQNAALTHQFMCVLAGTTAAAEPAGMTNPGNGAASPWGAAVIVDGTANFVWFGPVRTTTAKPEAPAVSIAALPASLTKGISIPSSAGQVGNLIFNSGGFPVNAGTFGLASAVNPTGSGSNLGLDDGTYAYNAGFGGAYTFETDAPLLAINQFSNGTAGFPNNSNSSIEIDGLRISDSPIITPAAIAGPNGCVVVDFRASGGRKIRRWTIRQNNVNTWAFIIVTPADTVQFPENPYRFRLCTLGNSFLGGANGYPFFLGGGYSEYIAALLGCDDVWIDFSGGTGWISGSGTGFKWTDPLKMRWTARCQPDVLFVQSSGGESPTTAVQAAVQLWLQQIRAALPNTLIYVAGQWPSSTGPSALVIANEVAVQQGILASGDPAVCHIPICNDPVNGSLVNGTGNIGAATGSGNADVLVQGDATHPSLWGWQFLGKRVAAFIGRSLTA